MTKSFPRPLLLILFIIVVVLVIIFLYPKLNKPKLPTSPKVYSNLFVYEDVINKKEPSFSLKLPDGWYRDLGVKDKERLLSFSPDRDKQGTIYRAVISAGVAPTKLDLAGEVARARKDIGSFAANHKFITDKSITIKGHPAHLLEYNTSDSDLLIHHTDIITVKDGYFIDIAAYAHEWAWPEFIDAIEKSFNTISFNPSSKSTQDLAIAKVSALPEVSQYLRTIPSGRVVLDHEDRETNSYIIHVYEIIDNHTATFNWYTVDKTTLAITKDF